jgi:hypothetical protein
VPGNSASRCGVEVLLLTKARSAGGGDEWKRLGYERLALRDRALVNRGAWRAR